MAANNYAACLAKVLKYEGGYVNDPHDPGGETNYGITIAVARANGYVGPMRLLPMEVVRTIYRKRYWDAVKGDTLPAGLDLCVFDYAVNSGTGRALPSLTAVSQGTTQDRIKAYCAARLAFLKRLRTWPRYGKGWSSRVADVQATALQMASASAALPDVPKPAPKDITSKTATDTTKIGGGAAAGGAVIIAGGAAANQAGWGIMEWSIVIVGLVLAIGLGVYAWHRWKEGQKTTGIRAAGTQAVASALSEPAATKQPEPIKTAVATPVSHRRANKRKTVKKRAPKKAAKKRRA